MRLRLADYAFVYRDVVLPDVCPLCGANLRSESALRMLAYDSVAYHGTYQPPTIRVPYPGLEYTDMSTDDNESVPIEYSCADCGATLAEGENTSD